MRLFVWLIVAALLHAGLFLFLKPTKENTQANLLKNEQRVQVHLNKNSLLPRPPAVSTTENAEQQPSSFQTPQTITATLGTQTTPTLPPVANKPKAVIQKSAKKPSSEQKQLPVVADTNRVITPSIEEQIKRKKTDNKPVDEKPLNPATNPLVSLAKETKAQHYKTNYKNAQPVSSRKPKYPKRAISRNQQGRVSVQLSILKSGEVDTAKLLKGSGYRLLDNSVLRFVKTERFLPAIENGFPIASIQVFNFRFTLQ